MLTYNVSIILAQPDKTKPSKYALKFCSFLRVLFLL